MPLLNSLLGIVWQYLREACGENDYERYRARTLERGENLLSQEAFFVERLELKYARPNRCC
ncbi:MAG: DUF466 domain-containing protein [Acidobacteria bacterium]|nr:MAG: DUF466 domain-containing protein [Acidobacteriota bacterium]